MPITYQREERLPAAGYIDVLEETTMRGGRPLANPSRIQAILDGSNFIITARADDGTLIGFARCLTDFAWVCYCAELAVRESYQGRGIGRTLLDTCSGMLGPGVAISLIAYPEAEAFYEHVGMQRVPGFYLARTDSA